MSFSPNTRGRAWVGTIHIANMEKAGLTKEQIDNPEYVANFFKELWEKSGKGRVAAVVVCISKDGLYHIHIVCYGNTTTLKKVADTLFGAHVEPQLGGKKQLKEYLLKEGANAEKGEHVLYSTGIEVIDDNQGKRSDLEEIETLLDDGYTPEEIFEEAFRYRKYERMIKQGYLRKRIKETPVIKNMWNEYHWGKSGSGKTYTYYRLCQEHSPDEVYLCNDYANSGGSGGGFDFYSNNPAKIIFLDEFRGNIPFATLLSILDVYSRNQMHARYQNVYNLWESVFICSIYPLEEVYRFMVDETQRNTDSIAQLKRRFNSVVYHWKDRDGNYRTYTIPACQYNSAEDMRTRAELFEKTVPYSKYEKYKEEQEEMYKIGESLFGFRKAYEGGDIYLNPSNSNMI